MKLLDFIVREAIITELQATTKEGAIREIVRSLQDAGALSEADSESVTRELLSREELGPTGIGRGVATPVDTNHRAVDRPTGAIALSRRGIEWDALDGEPVDLVFLMVSPYRPGVKVQAMETIARHVKDERLTDRLRQAKTREQVIGLLEEADHGSP
jgi:PTS system nitrogen regulatory IIA component